MPARRAGRSRLASNGVEVHIDPFWHEENGYSGPHAGEAFPREEEGGRKRAGKSGGAPLGIHKAGLPQGGERQTSWSRESTTQGTRLTTIGRDALVWQQCRWNYQDGKDEQTRPLPWMWEQALVFARNSEDYPRKPLPHVPAEYLAVAEQKS